MKEHLQTQLAGFFISVTLITAAMFILGLFFQPDMRFGYEAFAYPLIYGVIGSVPGLLMYSKKGTHAKADPDPRIHSDEPYNRAHHHVHVRKIQEHSRACSPDHRSICQHRHHICPGALLRLAHGS